ncbi:hypothetical protein DRE_04248 [Drechslerella stenobrocha 248]|uniref:Uncharacterized protein n=1 Tax=Drechslerella stenobrocha 248 TaxID=1043628 RepID=W7IBU0_9PEZI|nr:hypothetical protein DRE_04248 [Drechslerella stenobrocha 248]
MPPGIRVPAHAAISPTTPVAIILKQDQPTGRQVTGIVAQVLTRGDHHRGVKVRLTDGRVGRVQRILDALPAATGTAGTTYGEVGGGANGGYTETDVYSDSPRATHGRRGRGRGRGGARGRPRWEGGSSGAGPGPLNGEGEERGEGVYDLTAFIRDGRRGVRGRHSQRGRLEQQQESVQVARCPVCDDFEGDERAVQHHVESHFS